MERIFLSYHFDPKVKLLAGHVENMIKSHDIDVVTGKHLAGAELSEAIKTDIAKCDGLIYILTQREEGRTHDWVIAETAMANAISIPFIGIIEKDVPAPGPFIAREHISLISIDSAGLWLKLSATLGKWKSDRGRSIEAYLEPKDVVDRIRQNYKYLSRVQYRLRGSDYSPTEWKEDAQLKPTPSGLMMRIPGIKKDSEIEIEIVAGRANKWESDVVNQNLRIKLRHANGE